MSRHSVEIEGSSLAGATAAYSIIRPNPSPATLVIARADGQPLVTISLVDGSTEYGPGYEPDAAAGLFWEAITRVYNGPGPDLIRHAE